MLINASKNEYTILEEEAKTPIALNRKKTDELYTILAEKFAEIGNILMYEDDSAEARFLEENVLSDYALDSIDCDTIKNLSADILKLLEKLQNGKDKIPEPEELMTLEDIGFKQEWGSKYFYEKVLEDSDEITIVEELQIKGKPLYRKRTTVWTKIKGGRESKEIIYEDLKLDKKLRKIVKNTKEKIDSKSCN